MTESAVQGRFPQVRYGVRIPLAPARLALVGAFFGPCPRFPFSPRSPSGPRQRGPPHPDCGDVVEVVVEKVCVVASATVLAYQRRQRAGLSVSIVANGINSSNRRDLKHDNPSIRLARLPLIDPSVAYACFLEHKTSQRHLAGRSIAYA
jgi:hypothetical protein